MFLGFSFQSRNYFDYSTHISKNLSNFTSILSVSIGSILYIYNFIH